MPSGVCEVVGCPNGNTYRKNKEKAQYFRFPKHGSNTLKRWIENINRVAFKPEIDKDYYVCERHFAELDFIPPDKKHKKRRIKPWAVPKFHMRPPKEPEIVGDKRTRHVRASKKLERFEPENHKVKKPKSLAPVQYTR